MRVDSAFAETVTYARLRASGVVPRYFGLGFIQMDIEAGHRLHIWHPETNAIVHEEEVHDHRYDFVSMVLRGAIVNERWAFARDDAGGCKLEYVSCERDKPAAPVFIARGLMFRRSIDQLAAGDSYAMAAGDFHRTFVGTGGAVTLLKRGPKTLHLARRAAPLHAGHVCPFSKKIDDKDLWRMIEEMLS